MDEAVLAFLAKDAGKSGRLPPERHIAAELGLTRTAVRKTLGRLETEGRILRQVGRGTFLRADPGPAATLPDLIRHTSPREAMQARLLVEPELAGLAAVNATVDQIDGLGTLSREMRRVPDWRSYEQFDAQFHRMVAEGAGNRLLLAVHDTVNDVRRAVVWAHLGTSTDGPPGNYPSFAEHDAIVGAIQRRDRQGAAEAMRAHLRTTIHKLMGSD